MSDSEQAVERTEAVVSQPTDEGATKWVASPRPRPEPRDRNEAKLQKELRVLEGRSAMAEYEAARRAMYANTERLKALRLARDAALAAQPPAAKPARKKSSKGA